MRRLGMPLGIVGCLMAVHGCISTPAEDAAALPLEPVALTISNASDQPIRCVVMLAHFITRDTAVLGPGAAETLALERDRDARALAYGHHNNEPMMVENVLCGAVEDWAETRADIPLTAVRAGDASGYDAVCVRVDGVSCSVEETPAIN